MARTTQSSGSNSDQQVKQEMERTREDAERMASEAAATARERGRDTLEQAKERTAEQADQLASALESTADDLESSDGGEALSGYGRSMASMVRRFAGGLREHEIEELAGEITGYARRNPATFLAGTVALGFGLSRVMKASSHRGYEDEQDFGLDDEEAYELEARQEEDFDETMQASPSPSGTWPEDRGGERPGAGSQSGHLSPAVSTTESGDAAAGREDVDQHRERGGTWTSNEADRRSEP